MPIREVAAIIKEAMTEGSCRGTDMPFFKNMSREFCQFWPM
jgi:hypothetical protein